MRFLISRTSVSTKTQPCDEATFVDGRWTIDVPDLKSLLALVDKYDDLIVTKFTNEAGVHEIEIYDDYRE